MNAFLRGMATIGELNPRPFNEYPPQYSQWQCVANSFAQAGINLRLAMLEFSDISQIESKQSEFMREISG